MRCQVFMLIGWWHLPPSSSVLLLFVSHLLEAMVEAAASASNGLHQESRQQPSASIPASCLNSNVGRRLCRRDTRFKSLSILFD